MVCCDEIFITSHSPGRVAQMGCQELRRRYWRGIRTKEAQARVRKREIYQEGCAG